MWHLSAEPKKVLYFRWVPTKSLKSSQSSTSFFQEKFDGYQPMWYPSWYPIHHVSNWRDSTHKELGNFVFESHFLDYSSKVLRVYSTMIRKAMV